MSLFTTFGGGAEWLSLLAGLAAKATLVLLLAAAVAAALWRASAAARHLVWCVGVVGVLALPLLSALLPAWELPLLPAPAEAPASPEAFAVTPGVQTPPAAALSGTVPPAVAATPVEAWPEPPAGWLARGVAWMAAAGVLAGLLWLAAGFWGVARLGRRAEVVRDAEWLRLAHEAAERLGLRRPVLLLRSGGPVMPATWGLLWPTVVVPAVADQWPEERRRAVLAHELAHVKRFDCLTQALAQLACVLFWWHPAVWYAARRLRVERERACDDMVLRAGARASDYAAHLLEVARAHRALRLAAPAMVSMARPSHLESRLLWVLDAARPRTVPSPGAAALAIAGALLVLAPLSALRPTPARAESTVPVDAAARVHGTGTVQGRGKAAEDRAAKRDDKAAADAKAKGIATAVVQPDTPVIPRGPGWDNLTPDQLIGLRAVGVTPAWLEEMRRHGYTGMTVEEAMGMRAVGVTGAYVQEMAAAGYRGLSAEQITGLRALGVNGAYLRELRAMGFSDLSLDDVQGMRAMGVTARYVDELRAAGLDGLDAETITSLRAVGVTGDYIAGMRAAGVRADVETLTGLRALGVTPAYVRELASVGLNGLTTDELSSLRAMGVDAASVRELSQAGFRSLTVEQLIRLRASGVDRELGESYRRSRSNP